MKLTKQEQDIVRRKFSKYCIEVLNGEALNYLEELDRLWEQEINFSDLGESILNQFCSYDEIPESDYFQIMGMEVPVRDEAISNALYRLPEGQMSISVFLMFVLIGVIHMRNRKKKEPVAFEVIEAAVAGDVVAINQIVDYFQPYINSRCRRKFIDESGQIKYGIDEYMKRRMETKLITKILSFEIQL